MTEVLTQDHFAPHVGKLARFVGTRHALVIDRVEGDGRVPDGMARAPFVVIFRGPVGREALLSEGLYDCEIEAGPTVNIYVMPIHTPAPGRQEYQAVFN